MQAADFLADEKGLSTVTQALVKRLSLHDGQSPHPRGLYRMRSSEAGHNASWSAGSTSFPSHSEVSTEFEDRRELEAGTVRLLDTSLDHVLQQQSFLRSTFLPPQPLHHDATLDAFNSNVLLRLL
jgi:hypothetical protein